MNALIIVDIQNDFLPGGALAVAEGDQTIAVANKLATAFQTDDTIVVASQDWHPEDHGSFAANHEGKKPGEVIELDGLQQILWPTHCVEDTFGATFPKQLDITLIDRVFRKGTERDIDSYSGFFDNGQRKATGLGAFLREQNVTKVAVVGLATDYCVKFTALDALQLGFETHLVEDGCRGVELEAGDVAAALDDLRGAGVMICKSVDVLKS